MIGPSIFLGCVLSQQLHIKQRTHLFGSHFCSEDSMRSTNSNEASDAIRQRLAVHGMCCGHKVAGPTTSWAPILHDFYVTIYPLLQHLITYPRHTKAACNAGQCMFAPAGEAFMDMFDDNEAQQPSHRPRTTAERRQPSDARAGSPSAASTEEVDDLGFLPASQMHGRRQAAGCAMCAPCLKAPTGAAGRGCSCANSHPHACRRLPCSGGTAGPEGLSLQKQRRLFMAGRALDSSSSSRTQARRKVGQGPSSKEAEPIATADFERMRREVELLGELVSPGRHVLKRWSAGFKHASVMRCCQARWGTGAMGSRLSTAFLICTRGVWVG